MTTLYDKGPPVSVARLFADVPDYGPFQEHFWFDWGPVFYRGRLNKTARLLCVASDPGPTERLAGRALIGNAGQRVQGFLAKIGLTRSYACLNAFVYSLFPSRFFQALEILEDPALTKWRNRVFRKVTGSELQAIVAFGAQAQKAVALWSGRPDVPLLNIPHPTSRDNDRLIEEWRAAIETLRAIVTPDDDGTPLARQYGNEFSEEDYAPIPRGDLPFGFPPWLGDDAPATTGASRRRNSVRRPDPDDRHTLIWIAPSTEGN